MYPLHEIHLLQTQKKYHISTPKASVKPREKTIQESTGKDITIHTKSRSRFLGTKHGLSGSQTKTFARLLKKGTGLDSVIEIQEAMEERKIWVRNFVKQ